MIGGFLGERELVSDGVAGVMFNTGMLELTIADVFQIGAGPSMDWIWGCAETIQDEVSCAESGPYFGLDGRVAVVIGDQGPGTRSGFTLSADVHPVWLDDDHVGVTMLGGAGFELY
jgi:hypothetical protein